MQENELPSQTQKNSRKIRRKDFLKGSLFPVLAAGPAAGLLTKAAAQTERRLPAGVKPPLNQQTLNQLLGELSKGGRVDLRPLAMRDWRAALRQQFTLTPEQEAMLNAATPEQVAQVQNGFNDALANNKAMTVIPPAPLSPTERRTKVTCAVTTDGKSVTFTCSVVFGRRSAAEGTA